MRNTLTAHVYTAKASANSANSNCLYAVWQCRRSETVRKTKPPYVTISILVAFLLNSFGREQHLRQDQGVLWSVVVVQRGLLGVQLVVDDGQLAQALHKCVWFWCEDCGPEGKNKPSFWLTWFKKRNVWWHYSLILNSSGCSIELQHGSSLSTKRKQRFLELETYENEENWQGKTSLSSCFSERLRLIRMFQYNAKQEAQDDCLNNSTCMIHVMSSTWPGWILLNCEKCDSHLKRVEAPCGCFCMNFHTGRYFLWFSGEKCILFLSQR